MKRKLVAIVLSGVVCSLAASVSVWAMGKPAPKILDAPVPPASDMSAAQTPATMAHYMCPKCHVLSDTAGKCPKCDAEMVGVRVLAVKDGMASCCSCPGNCTCKVNESDMTKCTCGKDITKVDIKGKYVCACADPGKCTSVSDKPGKCQCKKDMVRAE